MAALPATRLASAGTFVSAVKAALKTKGREQKNPRLVSLFLLRSLIFSPHLSLSLHLKCSLLLSLTRVPLLLPWGAAQMSWAVSLAHLSSLFLKEGTATQLTGRKKQFWLSAAALMNLPSKRFIVGLIFSNFNWENVSVKFRLSSGGAFFCSDSTFFCAALHYLIRPSLPAGVRLDKAGQFELTVCIVLLFEHVVHSHSGRSTADKSSDSVMDH